MEEHRRRVRIVGITQGVGFRPTVWRIAHRLGLTGWVQNDSHGLLCEVQGPRQHIDLFLDELRRHPPPLARLDTIQTDRIAPETAEGGFCIRSSEVQVGESNPITPDVAVCSDCLSELRDEGDRRYRYPFINCTNCGPRFTIVEDVPYDRPSTTMKAFRMCHRCQAEYEDPASRRFHAQPNACPDCGPTVWYASREEIEIPSTAAGRKDDERDAIALFGEAIRRGKIVAAKGIGGFHLICDARNEQAIATLRLRKGRIEKPFAVMALDVEQIRRFAVVSGEEQALLESDARPIVLLKQRAGMVFSSMLEAVAPGNDFVGVLLPYSPLHQLLIEATSPLVVTSGNITEEPIVSTNASAATRLGGLADGFLLHDRDIHVVCDDSVVRSIHGRVLPIRRSRGYAPMPVRMPVQLCPAGPDVLAVGGEIKATFCVTKKNYAYLSQHIGDVGNVETLEALRHSVEHFLRLFRVDVAAVAGDLHPEYLSSQWGRQLASTLGVPFLPVQHHFAHAVSLLAEQPDGERGPILACCFDGTGYGLDGAIWGGEFLLASEREFQRVAHLRYFPLPGGDASIKRPYRTALALLAELGLPWNDQIPSVDACPPNERGLLRQQIERQLNCTATSSVGRLFDAAGSLMGVRQQVSYEAQAAMELEALAAEVIDEVDSSAYHFELLDGSLIQVDCQSVLRPLCEDVIGGTAPAVMAARFHHAVAEMICQVCLRVRSSSGVTRVGLTGGVFQNVLLLSLAEHRLTQRGFEVLTHGVVPPNDGGLALGQAVIARNQGSEAARELS